MFPSKAPLWRRLLPLVLVMICVPVMSVCVSHFFGDALSEKGMAMTEDSIRRAAVQCYALEGFYPADVAYLQDIYGLTFSTERYVVDYQYIASNLLPDITVLSIPQ